MKSVRHLSAQPRLVLLAVMSLALVTVSAATSELDSLRRKASDFASTKEGRKYSEALQQAILPVFSGAMDTCNKSTPDTKEPASFAFVVAADGTVTRVLYSKDIPFGACVGARLRGIKKVPKPPRDGWVVSFGAANHSAAAGPPDTPKLMKSQESLAAYDRAIAPYVAKARATYPGAKKRFLAGLPPGYRLLRARPAPGSRWQAGGLVCERREDCEWEDHRDDLQPARPRETV